jgi:hypothetical protein
VQQLSQEIIPLYHEQTAEQIEDEAFTALHLLQHVSLELRPQPEPFLGFRQRFVELSLQLVFQIWLRCLLACLYIFYSQL